MMKYTIKWCHMDAIIAIDRLGRLVVPKNIRKRLGIDRVSKLRASIQNRTLVLDVIDEDIKLRPDGDILLIESVLDSKDDLIDHRVVREERLDKLAE